MRSSFVCKPSICQCYQGIESKKVQKASWFHTSLQECFIYKNDNSETGFRWKNPDLPQQIQSGFFQIQWLVLITTFPLYYHAQTMNIIKATSLRASSAIK